MTYSMTTALRDSFRRMISMWILTFARWGQYFLCENGTADQELADFSKAAHDLAMVRPMEEWRSKGASEQGELATFLDQVEELLAPSLP